MDRGKRTVNRTRPARSARPALKKKMKLGCPMSVSQAKTTPNRLEQMMNLSKVDVRSQRSFSKRVPKRRMERTQPFRSD